MIKKLDWYFIKKFIGTFVYSLLIMALIASVIDYSEKVRDFALRKPSFMDLVGYYQNFTSGANQRLNVDHYIYSTGGTYLEALSFFQCAQDVQA